MVVKSTDDGVMVVSRGLTGPHGFSRGDGQRGIYSIGTFIRGIVGLGNQ
jgi:hypothetical protein